MKRLRNSSGISDETVAQVVEWIARRLGISQFDVECRTSQGTVAGRAYTQGSRVYHGNRRPFVVLRVGTETIDRWESISQGHRRVSLTRRGLGTLHQSTAKKKSTQRFPAILTPYQYAHLRGRRYVLANRVEALVYLTAHELRHLWQAARLDDKRKAARLPLYHGARGRFSEIDTEGFAITMLREFKRRSGSI